MCSMKVATVRMTIEELDCLPDDGNRYELIDGELFVTASPLKLHQFVSKRLFKRLDDHVDANDLGEAYCAPFDVYLKIPGATGPTRVQPDMLFVSKARSHIIRDWVRGAPDLVVEIVSESSGNVDYVEKRDVYDAAGVREYWIVNPFNKTTTVYRFGVAGSPFTLSGEDSLSSPLLPGFQLRLAELFR